LYWRIQAAEEAKRKAEEEAKRKAEEEAKRKAEEEARRKVLGDGCPAVVLCRTTCVNNVHAHVSS